MNTTDPISDYLTRLRNAVRAKHRRVDVPTSKLKREMTRILAEQKFIGGFAEVSDSKQGLLRINLKYSDGTPALTGLSRVSRPGRRVYVSAQDVPRVLNGLGIALISTSRGVLTDQQAREMNVGGEVLCHIW
jgi:small subunit ribosomal protein S8